ncbi:MAG: PucR family transcriptional regulator [Eubacteriaceae bacterium]
MKLNIHIIFDELNSFSPKIRTYRDIALTLRQIRLFDFNTDYNLQQDCIYILEASAIMEHVQILHDIDLISIGYIDKYEEEYANLSVILLPEDSGKITIFNKVQDIFEKYRQWNYDLMRSIAAHKSIQLICDLAASVLNNPFAILDIALKRIVKGGQLPEDYKGTIWELVMEKGYTPSETFSLSTDKLYDFLRHHNKPYAPYGSPYTKYSDLMVNLYLDGKLFAFIATTSINTPFTQGQISLLQLIKDVMELAISSSIEFKGSNEVVTYYLEKLLKGFPVDEKIISYHLNERGWSSHDNFRVYTMAYPSGKELSDSQADFCLYRIKRMQEDVIIFLYENSIIVIRRQLKGNYNDKYEKKLVELLSKLGLHCGCSNFFNRFSDLKYYYIQSKAAFYEGETAKSENILWDFADYYFPHIISLMSNSTSLKSMCHANILRLRNHDNTYDTDFVHCLRIYLYNGCNTAQTGKELFMHRNTLTYRLEKITAIIEMDVRQLSEKYRMQLWFSCLICNYL